MKTAIILGVLLFLSNIPSIYYGLYITYPWFDIVQHLLGGFLVAMFMYHYLRDHLREGAFLKNMVILIGTTALVGVIWEFAEFIANRTLVDPFYEWFGIRAYFMGDLTDTMKDLLMDIVGALAFILSRSLYLAANRREAHPAPNYSADRH